MTANDPKSKSLDALWIQLEVQASAFRMTLKERKEARRLMEIIFKTDRK